MPYVLVEGFLAIREYDQSNGSSDNNVTINNNPSSSRNVGPRYSRQQLKQSYLTAVSGLKGRIIEIYYLNTVTNITTVLIFSKVLITNNVFTIPANEIAEMKNFNPGVGHDHYTVNFPHHPCIILNALEVLGFHVISSAPKVLYNNGTKAVNGTINTYRNQPDQSVIWTLKKEFEQPF